MSYSQFIIDSVRKDARSRFASEKGYTILDFSRNNSKTLTDYADKNSAFIIECPLRLGWVVVKTKE